MATDEDYMAFLDKANKDRDDGLASAEAAKNKPHTASVENVPASKRAYRTLDAEKPLAVPTKLAAVAKDAIYISDADEPFDVVSLRWDGAAKTLPDEGEQFCFMAHNPSPSSTLTASPLK